MQYPSVSYISAAFLFQCEIDTSWLNKNGEGSWREFRAESAHVLGG